VAEDYGRPRLSVVDCGVLDFDVALDLQQRLVEAKLAGAPGDYLLLTEHPPVVTLGRSADARDDAEAERLAARGVRVHRVSRGGRATYHGPGQIVGYPIVTLRGEHRDLHGYLLRLQSALVAGLRAHGIPALTRSGHTGVWLCGKKVGSIGVCVRSWTTYHGFSLNVTAESLPPTELNPCGMAPDEFGCLSELGFAAPRKALGASIAEALAEDLGLRSLTATLQDTLTNAPESGMMASPTTIGGR
jgi:lipoyl(octanoyl) transferase